MTNSGTQNGTTHFVHDRRGNVIAEADGAGVTQREYIWLPETQTAATGRSRAQVDRPVAVVGGGQTYKVHVDHLNRPIMMTNAAKASVWAAVWAPWGGVHAITGSASLDARLPGQWFQLESGLHYNWHRHYDPTIGRYTQPDPLGFVDGPSVYAYARGNPQTFVDPDGRAVQIPGYVIWCLANPACRKAAMAAGRAAATAIGNFCKPVFMARGPQNVVPTRIMEAYADERPADRCEWLKENAGRFTRDEVKKAEKSWGCRRSRQNKE